MAKLRKPKRPKANAKLETVIAYGEKLEAYNMSVAKQKAESDIKKSILGGDTSALKKAKGFSKKK